MTVSVYEVILPGNALVPIRRRAKRGKGTMPRVYFAGCSCCGLVKIGFSRNYRERMSELEERSGHRGLIVLGTITGGRLAEAGLHALFFRDCVEGEWFRPSADVMAYIRHSTIPAGWRGY